MPKRKQSRTLPTNQKTEGSLPSTLIATKQEIFYGPIPPPDALKAYKEVDPNFPNRIMLMAESLTAVDVRRKDRWSFSLILGQVLSFLMACGGIAACVGLALSGMKTEAIAAIIGGFVPMVLAAIANFKRPSK